MSLKNKIEKIRKSRFTKSIADEKTGVLNGLVVLGAIAGAMLLAGTAKAAQPDCDPNTHEISNTKIVSNDFHIDTNSWDNHCWWDHSAGP